MCTTTLVAGCATPTPSTTNAKLVNQLGEVPVYTKAPCWMQRKWTAHNAAFKSWKKGKPVAMKAPCDYDEQPKPKSMFESVFSANSTGS